MEVIEDKIETEEETDSFRRAGAMFEEAVADDNGS